jgi:heme exporter protein B
MAALLVGAWQASAALATRDLRVALREPAEWLAPLGFVLSATTLIPIAVGSDPALLRTLAPGLLWLLALLASLLSLPRLFAPDLADGTLDHWRLSPTPAVWLVLAKVGVHWVLCGLPLVLLAPLLGLAFGLADPAALGLSLLVGTPVLSLLGALGAVLTLQARGGAALLSLLVLPLSVPVLLFGTQAAQPGPSQSAAFSLLGAVLAASLALLPWGTAAALQLIVD